MRLLDITERTFDNDPTSTPRSRRMDKSTPLAFIDVETTGLSPTAHRITEIGIVTVSGECVERWTTLVNPLRHTRERQAPRRPRSAIDDADAPRFVDIAGELGQRLAGRLLIAHNARFDFAFLHAEFGRAHIDFRPAVVCSVALARTFYPHLPRHDLDTLAERHALTVEERHRALPDADLLWRFWQVLLLEHAEQRIACVIDAMLAAPTLPPHLDPSLIDRLPEAAGAYVLHGERNRPMHVGAADNLRLHLRDYFRIDRATAHALQYSHRITNITWHAMRGPFGARLRAITMDSALLPGRRHALNSDAVSWQIRPDAVPSLALVALGDACPHPTAETFGLFASERKARNALRRLATRRRLCHLMLGIMEAEGSPCLACSIDGGGSGCARRVDRARALTRIFLALKPMRVAPWPYAGPIGVRERTDMHVFNHWRYLGTATNDDEVSASISARGGFDKRIFDLVRRELTRSTRTRIVELGAAPDAFDRVESESA
jgi:DNA polymerase III subunit epsilon